MTTYTILVQQSLFDIAVEMYGDVEGVFWLLGDNPTLIGLTDRIQAGQSLNIREDQINPRQATVLAEFGPFQTIEETDKPIGVNYWKAEEYRVP